jgi:hypothetical protein
MKPDSIRTAIVCTGWLEADWVDNGKDIVYRLPDIGLSKTGIAVAYQLDRGVCHIKAIEHNVGRSRSTVLRQLSMLQDAGYIERYANDNARWMRLKPIGVFGVETA